MAKRRDDDDYGYDTKKWFIAELWCNGKLKHTKEESGQMTEFRLRAWLKIHAKKKRCIGRMVLLEQVLGGDKPWNNPVDPIYAEVTRVSPGGNVYWVEERI